MTQQEKILDLARGELGVKESPAGSNTVKYNTEFYGRAVAGGSYPWCVVFQWWLFRQAGLSALFYGGGKTASCGTLASWAKKRGQFVTAGYRPGDLAFFRFSGDVIEHIGLVERVRADGTLVTIEGNTGASSDANGGEVQRRVRANRLAAGAFRPAYEEEREVTQQEFNTMMDVWLKARAAAEPSGFSSDARAWAEKEGIVQGTADGAFQYKSYCTREQMAVFLHRLAQKLEKA